MGAIKNRTHPRLFKLKNINSQNILNLIYEIHPKLDEYIEESLFTFEHNQDSSDMSVIDDHLNIDSIIHGKNNFLD